MRLTPQTDGDPSHVQDARRFSLCVDDRQFGAGRLYGYGGDGGPPPTAGAARGGGGGGYPYRYGGPWGGYGYEGGYGRGGGLSGMARSFFGGERGW